MSIERRDYLRLGLRILDEQIVDSEGRRCGRVEDVEVGAGVGEVARVIGIRCGATAWKRRLALAISELMGVRLFEGDDRPLGRIRDVIATRPDSGSG